MAIIEGWGTDAADGREMAGNSRNRGTGTAVADVESAGVDSSGSADVGDGGRDDAAMSEAPGGTTGVVLLALGSEWVAVAAIVGWSKAVGSTAAAW